MCVCRKVMMNKIRLLSYILPLIASSWLYSMPAYAHHEAVLPERKYQKELARLPMQEYMHYCLPLQAPFKTNAYETYLTLLDRNNGILDLIFYAQNIKHTPLSGGLNVSIKDHSGRTLFDGPLSQDAKDTCRLRFGINELLECNAHVNFTDNGLDYNAEFEFDLGTPKMNYAVIYTCLSLVILSFGAVIIAKFRT